MALVVEARSHVAGRPVALPVRGALGLRWLALGVAGWATLAFALDQVARVALPTGLLDLPLALANLATIGLGLTVAVAAWLVCREDVGVVLPATLAPLLLVARLLAGAVLGLLDLATLADVADGGLGLLGLGALVWTAVALRTRSARGRRDAAADLWSAHGGRDATAALFARVVDVTLLAVFAASLSGLTVRATGASWACAGALSCRMGLDALSDLQADHRLFGYVVVGLACWLGVEARRTQRAVAALGWASLALVGGVLLQGAIGVVSVWQAAPALDQALHTVGNVTVWSAAVVLAALTHRAAAVPVAPPLTRAAARPLPGGARRTGPTTFPSTLTRWAATAQVHGQAESPRSLAPGGERPASGASRVRGDAAGTDGGVIAAARPTTLRLVAAYVQLTKPRVMSLLLATTATAMVIAARGWPPLGLLAATLLGGALMSGGAGAINHYVDRDIDPLMGRTAWRPIPSGVIAPARALAFGIALAALATAVLLAFTNPLATLLALLGLLGYVFIYTLWLKRSTPSNIVIGGAAGAIPPLVGWAAVTGEVSSLTAWYLFALIFFWTPPHFWALSLLIRKYYERAGVPMLPVVRGEDETRRQIVLYACLLVALSLVLSPFGMMGLLYFGSALVLGGLFIADAVRLWREATPAAARRLYLYSILYLFLLFVAMAVDRSL